MSEVWIEKDKNGHWWVHEIGSGYALSYGAYRFKITALISRFFHAIF